MTPLQTASLILCSFVGLHTIVWSTFIVLLSVENIQVTFLTSVQKSQINHPKFLNTVSLTIKMKLSAADPHDPECDGWMKC